jgi:hypothetical protein
MRMHSATMPAQAVANTMTSSLAMGGTFDTFHAIKGADAGRAAANLSNPILETAQISYFLTLRDTKTNNQYMHPEAVETLHQWYEVFYEHSMFSIIKNKTAFSFPVLTAPSFGSNAWTCTPFHYVNSKNGLTTNWEVIVTLGINGDTKRTPSCGRDVVDMCVISPSIMTNCEIYFGENTNDIERAWGQLQMACIEDSKYSGFKTMEHAIKEGSSTRQTRLEEKFGHNYYYDQEKAERYCLYSSFVSCKQESSTGNVVVPLILKRASFILPCIQDDDPDVHYSILQPHKFAYLVRITNLASGWEIRASVNLTASASVVQRMFYLQSDTDDRLLQAILDSNASQTKAPNINRSLQEESADNTLRRLDRCVELKKTLSTKFQTALNSNAVLSIFPQKPTLEEIFSTSKMDMIAKCPEIFNQIKNNPSIWKMIVAYDGIRVFGNQIETQKTLVLHQCSVIQGNAFIALYKRAMTADGGSIASDSDIALIANTLYSICRSAAKHITDTENIFDFQPDAPPRVPPITFFNAFFLERKISKVNDYDLNFDAEKILSFLLGSCKGTDPENWISQACPQFIPDIMTLIHNILKKPKAFTPLLPGYIGSHESLQKLSEYIVNSMPVLNPRFSDLHMKYKEYCDHIDDDSDTLVDNMTYFLLTYMTKEKTEKEKLYNIYIETLNEIDRTLGDEMNNFETDTYDAKFTRKRAEFEPHAFNKIKNRHDTVLTTQILELRAEKEKLNTKYTQYQSNKSDPAKFIENEKNEYTFRLYMEHADINSKIQSIQFTVNEIDFLIKQHVTSFLPKKTKALEYINRAQEYIKLYTKKNVKITESKSTMENQKKALLRKQNKLEKAETKLKLQIDGGDDTVASELADTKIELEEVLSEIAELTQKISTATILMKEYAIYIKNTNKDVTFNEAIYSDAKSANEEPRNPLAFDASSIMTQDTVQSLIKQSEVELAEKEERCLIMGDDDDDKAHLTADIEKNKAKIDLLRQLLDSL